ncbi:MAG: response regulator [Chthoniobacterales bacterium]
MPFHWVLSLLIFATCLLTGLAFVSFSQKNNPIALPYGLAVLICAGWCVISIFEIHAETLEQRVFLLHLRATILPWLPLLILETIYRFVYGRKLLIGWIALAFATVPIVNITLAWSSWHSLWRYGFHLQRNGEYTALLFHDGPWMILYAIWAYFVEFGMVIIAIVSLRHMSPWSKKAMCLILFSIFPPAVMDVLFLLGKSPTPGLNYAPVTFAFSGLFSAWAILSHGMMTLAPVARSLLMEHIPDLILVVDHQNCLVDLNISASHTLNISLNKALGRPLREILNTQTSLLEVMEKNREAGIYEIDLNITEKKRFYDLSLIPVPENSKTPLAYVLLLRDVTLHHDAKLLMQEAKESAESTAEAKGRFLALMSHEIRTPLNGVIGFTELLHQTSLSSEQHEYVELIEKSGESLLVIINDILDYSKIDAGFLEVHSEAFSLVSLIDRVCRFMAPSSMANNLKFDWNIDYFLPDAVDGDEIRIGQILTNLIGNAIKFTSEGYVKLEVIPHSATTANSDPSIDFVVTDTGIGMSKETVSHLFEAFTQADSSTARQFGGTGLGLAVSQRLAGLMKGKITVSSTLGKGSVFTLNLPLKKAIDMKEVDGEKIPHGVMEGDGAKLSILVVEDNAINRRVMENLLKKIGHSVELAADGNDGLRHFKDGSYDLIFMDIEMPGIDGFETVKRLREIEKTLPGHPRIPVIALTAHAMSGYEQQCLDAGMDGYLTKPIRIEELKRMLGGIKVGRKA